jgi:hypothetical protein
MITVSADDYPTMIYRVEYLQLGNTFVAMSDQPITYDFTYSKHNFKTTSSADWYLFINGVLFDEGIGKSGDTLIQESIYAYEVLNSTHNIKYLGTEDVFFTVPPPLSLLEAVMEAVENPNILTSLLPIGLIAFLIGLWIIYLAFSKAWQFLYKVLRMG